MDYNKELNNLLVSISMDNKLNFYAHMLLTMNIKLTDELDTAGVYYRNEKFYIDINPEFMFHTLKYKDERMAVLIHEVLHALYSHMDRKESRDHTLFNIAGDLCINQYILHKERVLEDRAIHKIAVNLGKDFDFPPKLMAEEYYELLLKDKQNNPKKYENYKLSIEDLLESDALSDVEKEILKDKLKDMVTKAKNRAKGNLPNEIEILLDLLFTPPVVDWRNQLRDVVGNKKIFKTPTMKRRNRRFPHRMDLNGKLKRTGFDIAVVLDVSGSMNEEDINLGLSEIKNICEWSNSSMWLVQVDTKASEPEEFTSWTNTFKRQRSGGTLLYPGVEKLDECGVEYNALIFITDGYMEESFPEILDVPVFFLSTTGDLNFDVSVCEHYKEFNLKENRNNE